MFLEVHGAGGDSSAAVSLLTRHPLPPGREASYRALNCTPSMGPAASHALSTKYPSLGSLMAAMLDPSKCACILMKRICVHCVHCRRLPAAGLAYALRFWWHFSWSMGVTEATQ